MTEQEMRQRVAEIICAQAQKDKRLQRAWAGNDALSIESTNLCTLTRLTVSMQARKRESRKERMAGSEPYSPKSEPWTINLWQDYLNEDWAGYSWEHVDDFWEECSECHNHPRQDCPSCGGSGRKRCSRCGGDGTV